MVVTNMKKAVLAWLALLLAGSGCSNDSRSLLDVDVTVVSFADQPSYVTVFPRWRDGHCHDTNDWEFPKEGECSTDMDTGERTATTTKTARQSYRFPSPPTQYP
jgi:hypothetical protein